MTDHENNRTVLNALPVGYRFNEFEIKEVIGGGGFGIVYRAWDHQLERTIAIKEFMPSSLAVRNEDMTLVLRSERFSKAFSAGLNSFIQEARLLARFNHPNLLHVLRFWVQNDTAYMGTLFYSGTTLSRLREQQPNLIDEAWIRRMLPMLFGAIKTIHDAGYLHRDISPENIQIQDNGLPVLLDFGSARRTIGNLSDETETMLRPGYAPIEQYTDDNDSEQGAWTDIYAVGAVLHTLIVGSPPPVSVVRSIQDNYQPLAELKPAGYSLPLLQAVDKALALRVEDRPQSIDAFAELIEMPVSSIDDVLSVKKTGTMLALVEEEEQAPAMTDWRRYKVPGMVAAGVLVGIIA
ncbi:serine/threonine-protein kinase, partial [Klebsiella aerogenes]|nr:serine/threonine-protein kinase [Klebsiella aerogenes]